ncbi:MAG TPA: TetR/AcrR family transcriptional regulator [Acidimicrobiales bacterium]|jgi:AcrR family transcriptional regulator|nr:TetR/AcrR family transcriptional regulator [Acidimicrobiales bacterium]
MAKKRPAPNENGRSDLDAIPAWKSQSVERSLQSARARAQERSDRFVNAGIELIKSTGDTGFTVQEVVDQSGMSIRTFYLFFATKDDLLLAIHETILASEVEPRLRQRTDAEPDVVNKIKVFIEALFELSGNSAPVTRAFMVQQHRLAESRPDDLDRAMEPQLNLVTELIQDAADAGRLREGLNVKTSGHLVHQLVHGLVEARVVGSHKASAVSPEQVWDFCSSALGVAPQRRRAPARAAARR